MLDEAERVLAGEELAGERISSLRAEVKRTDELHAEILIPKHKTAASKNKFGIEKILPSERMAERTSKRISERCQEIVTMIVHKKK